MISEALQPRKMLCTTSAAYFYNACADNKAFVVTHSIQFKKSFDDQFSEAAYREHVKQREKNSSYKS
jgi:hypothetical protein